jgi:hypothetical protein
MKQNKMSDRYVVTHNDDGQFHVNVMGDTTVARTVALRVCASSGSANFGGKASITR